MEIESMKSGAAASYQGSAAASTKTLDAAVQPEASTQAGLSQTADKKPTVQNFFTEKDQEDKDLSEEKDAKQGTQLKKAVNDLNKQMKNSEAIPCISPVAGTARTDRGCRPSGLPPHTRNELEEAAGSARTLSYPNRTSR